MFGISDGLSTEDSIRTAQKSSPLDMERFAQGRERRPSYNLESAIECDN